MCPHDAQRVASALDIIGLECLYSAPAERIKRAQRMARVCIAGHALQTRWVCAGCALGVRQVDYTVGVRQTSTDEHTRYNEYPACAWCWSNALCACLASFWHVHPCVELRAHFCACPKIPTHTTHEKECIALVQRARRRLYE